VLELKLDVLGNRFSKSRRVRETEGIGMTKSKKDQQKALAVPHKMTERDVAELYEPTPREREVIENFRAQQNEPAPRMKVTKKKGVQNISHDHPEFELGKLLIMETLGTVEPDFMDGLILQLAKAGTKGGVVNESRLNFMLSVVKGVEPKDQMEAMLAAQMAATHNATMTYAERLADSSSYMESEMAEKALNKLARTFTTQVEALKKYRTGGKQTVTVEHVTVNAGGQAVVGNVQGGGGHGEK
jgi:hypothetical protein